MLPPESSKNKAPVDGGSLIFFARDEGSAKKSGFEFQRVNAKSPRPARGGAGGFGGQSGTRTQDHPVMSR